MKEGEHQMSNQLIPLQEIERMGTIIAQSGLFGAKKPQEAIALCLLAQAFGMHPAMAAQDFDIIQGRPAKKSDAMLRSFLESGGKVKWNALDDTIADATFSHPAGGEVRITWDMTRAKQAGLSGKDMWRKFPRQMLRARCVSEGVRTVCPGATSGLYVPEEIQDFTHEEKDITPSPTPEKKAENVAKAKSALKKPEVVEGTATEVKIHARGTISGDPSEGDLSQVAPLRPAQADIDKMLAAFAKLDMDADMVGKEYGKPLVDWTIEDMTEAREWYKARKVDWELKQVELKSTQDNEEVI